MKKSMLILIALLLSLLTACGGTEGGSVNGSTSDAVAAYENFTLAGKTYAVEAWERSPDYDSGDALGYGLNILMVDDEAPITFTMSATGEISDQKSLLGLRLNYDGRQINTTQVSFIAVSEAEGYAGRATFYISLPKDAALPASGELYRTDSEESQPLDLTGLTVVDVKTAPAGDSFAGEDEPDEPPSAGASSLTEEFCGDWTLNTIRFVTPEADNGVFSIDASLELSEGFEYGLALGLDEDGTLSSDMLLDDFIATITELPFVTEGLNFKNYSEWSSSNSTIKAEPDGPTLEAATGAGGELSLGWFGEVDIISQKAAGGTTKSGTVELEIIMTFVRG